CGVRGTSTGTPAQPARPARTSAWPIQVEIGGFRRACFTLATPRIIVHLRIEERARTGCDIFFALPPAPPRSGGRCSRWSTRAQSRSGRRNSASMGNLGTLDADDGKTLEDGASPTDQSLLRKVAEVGDRTPLAPPELVGERLAHFQVVGPLGKGGMGV